MYPCLRSSPKPGTRAAGRTRPRLLSTLRGWRRAWRPLLTPSAPPAPRPHPPRSPRCPAVTQVRAAPAGGYRAGAPARSACWRPPAERRRTITTPTGLGGPGRWRTSTPSTETLSRCSVVCFHGGQLDLLSWVFLNPMNVIMNVSGSSGFDPCSLASSCFVLLTLKFPLEAQRDPLPVCPGLPAGSPNICTAITAALTCTA